MLYRLFMLAIAVVASSGFAAAAQGKTQVYLMRGLMDVSTGLDDLAAKLKRRGVSASVASYTAEAEVTARALRNYKVGTGCPIVIVGHSLGADAAVGMSRTLQQAGVPVALLVAFSPATAKDVPGNVVRVVNYYQSNSVWNNTYTWSSGGRRSLRNVNLAKEAGIDHFNIEKMARLHDETIRAVLALSGGCGPGLRKAATEVAPKP